MLTNILCFHDIVVERMYFFLAVSSSSLYLTDMKDDVLLQKVQSEHQNGGKRGIQVNLNKVNMARLSKFLITTQKLLRPQSAFTVLYVLSEIPISAYLLSPTW